MMFRTISLVVVTFLLASCGGFHKASCALTPTNPLCADVNPAMKELPIPPQRSIHNGFSLIPLDESGWLIGTQQPKELMLGKLKPERDESTVIRAYTVLIPDFKSHDEFMGFAKVATAEADPVRFKSILEEAKSVTVNGQICGRIKSIYEDHAAKIRTKKVDFMILESYSLVCQHPQKNMAVVVVYSHRYYLGNEDRESESKAGKVFETLELTNF